MRTTFEQRVAVWLAAATFVVLALAALLFVNIRQWHGEYQLAEGSHKVLKGLGQLTTALEVLDSGQRSYVATGQEQFRESCRVARADARGELSLMEANTSGNALQNQQYNKLAPLVRQLLLSDETVLRLRRDVGVKAPGLTVELARTRFLRKEIQKWISSMEEEERLLLKQRLKDVEVNSKRTERFAAVGIFINLAILYAVYLIARREVQARRLAQSSLEANEVVLRQFVEHTPAAVAMLDEWQRYLIVSHRWRLNFGIGDRQIIGMPHSEVLPELAQHQHEVIGRCLMGAVERREEDKLTRADGRLEWLRWEIRPWRKAGGGVGGLILFSEIITERKEAEERQRAMTEGLQAVLGSADELLKLPSLDDVLRRAVELGREYLGLERCAIYLTMSDGTARGTYGTDMHGQITSEKDHVLDVPGGWIHHVTERAGGRRWGINPDFEFRDWARNGPPSPGAVGQVAFHLIHGPQGPLGSLHTDNAITGKPLTESGQQLVSVYCSLLGGIIERKRAEERLRVSEERFRAAADGSLDALLVLRSEHDAAGEVVDFSFVDINARGERLTRRHRNDLIGRRIGELFPFMRNDGHVQKFVHCFATRQTIEYEYQLSGAEMGPKWLRQQVVALSDGVAVSLRDITAAKASEQQLAQQGKELREANSRLADLSLTDALTGLRNRRAFDERLGEEVRHSSRYTEQHPLSLIMLDVDKFKTFNDTFGHPAGDEILRRVADLLLQSSRDNDLVARYGGEEFALILPHTDQEGAIVQTERIRQAIEEADWPKRAITVSAGVATFTDEMDDSALIAAADAALYQSKSSGRNCVTHAAALREAVPA